MLLIICAYIADLIFGDPGWLPHPVKGMGKLIALLDEGLNSGDTIWIGRMKGIVLTIIVVGISGIFVYLPIFIANKINPLLGILIWVYFGYTTLSIRDLGVKARAILRKLESNSLPEARIELSKIVGRDTQDLSGEKVTKAAIESIAESTTDGIAAPLFYLILGGPVLAIIYKAINTLDSMVGYRNERYIHFGWFSARLDDIANFLPARITGLLMPVSSFFLRKNYRGSFQIMLRDGKKHPSWNSGISEAAMAGALNIQLGGPSMYQGKITLKPYIGEDEQPARPALINEALAISFLTSLLIVLLGVLVRWAI